jgi:hypothetical protein
MEPSSDNNNIVNVGKQEIVIPVPSSSLKPTKRGKKQNVSAKDFRIMLHLQGQNKVKKYGDKLKEDERMRRSSSLQETKKQKKGSSGAENEQNRSMLLLRQKIKKRIKKLTSATKNTGEDDSFGNLWSTHGTSLYGQPLGFLG